MKIIHTLTNKRKYTNALFSRSGKAETPMLLLIIALGFILCGGLLVAYKPGNYPYLSLNQGALCCDSGNGNDCHPIVNTTYPAVTYNNPKYGTQQYGLLKSQVKLRDPCHLKDSGQAIS